MKNDLMIFEHTERGQDPYMLSRGRRQGYPLFGPRNLAPAVNHEIQNFRYLYEVVKCRTGSAKHIPKCLKLSTERTAGRGTFLV